MKSLLLLLAICGTLNAQEQRPTILSAPGGRFAFGQISPMRKDQYMLDTATGRLWEVTEDANGVRSLNPVHYALQGNTPPLNTTNALPDMFEQMRIKDDIRAMMPPGIGVNFTTNAPAAK